MTEVDWLAAARQYIAELPEPPMGGTVDVLLQMLADENERLREELAHYKLGPSVVSRDEVARAEADAKHLAAALQMARGFLGYGIKGNPMSAAWVADEALRQHSERLSLDAR
jgi:hypothetical protein